MSADPCGTTRMHKSIKEGVVDKDLKVYGVKNLRVVDASVFPVIPDCRIQNAVYMVAEKVSHMNTSNSDNCEILITEQGADAIKAEYPDLYSS